MDDAFRIASVERLKRLISDYDEAKSEFYGELSIEQVQEFTTRSIAAIDQIAGRSSVHCDHVRGILDLPGAAAAYRVERLIGVVRALAVDVEGGFLRRNSTLIRGEVFSDFLEMAAHLVDSNYKDAAAVIAGSALEAHIKQLCQNREISLERERNGQTRSINADTLNAELAKLGAYTNLDQKNVTAWLGLRNDAAHGNYDEYSKQQVMLMIDSIRDFIARNPE